VVVAVCFTGLLRGVERPQVFPVHGAVLHLAW
jgi:hypothetical protein